jgi:hypothetical protein
VRNRIRTQGDEVEIGRFWAPASTGGEPKVSAYVRRWRDIIDENRRRIDYLTAIIQHDPSLSDGLSYLRGKHADLLPPSLVE